METRDQTTAGSGPVRADSPSLASAADAPLVRTRTWQRAEALAVLVAAVLAYASLDASWLLFAGLLLVPDLGMIGYLAGPRVGALTYNAVHVYVGPAAAVAAGLAGVAWALPVGLIWLAHIGMDRALGYGLKLPSGFRDTHLGPIGR